MEFWLVFKKWDCEYFLKYVGDVDFVVGFIYLKFSDYYKYVDFVEEECFLYIFDFKFVEKVLQLVVDYDVLIYFREDLFCIFGEERLDYWWLIVGFVRFGFLFYIDFNSIFVWNVVVCGVKKWVMYLFEVVFLGVFLSFDGVDVVILVFIIEWFMNFYGEIKKWVERLIECIC